jgi:tape measure domain-containing protein
MANLKFNIEADYQRIVRLREEVVKLKAELSRGGDTKGFDKLNSTQKELDTLVQKTSKAEAAVQQMSKANLAATNAMTQALKNSLRSAEDDVTSYARKILEQKGVIKGIEADVARFRDLYGKSFGQQRSSYFGEYKGAKRALDEEKAALFGLTTQQTEAKIKVRELKREYQDYNDALKNSRKHTNELTTLLKRVGGVYAVGRLGKEIIDVTGQMQMLNVSFKTLLQSEEKAKALMGELVQNAVTTPFQLTELATGAKQLVAYGFAAEEVNDTLKRLGNVASGLGLPLERLTYLYGTTRTQGRLYARDMLQFTTSGIPLLQVLADMYGKTTEQVNKMVSAGEIGFPEVQRAFEQMTNKGGKFYNLMQEQAKTIPGQISNIQDSITMMLNDIGQSQTGLISGTLSVTKAMIDNYQDVGKAILTLVATYGTYKTAVLIAAAAEKVRTTWGVYDIATKKLQIAATIKAALAQTALNKAILANPYAIAAAAVIALVGVLWMLSDSTTAQEKAQKRLNETMEKAEERKSELMTKAQTLINTIRSETSSVYEQVRAWNELIKKYEFFSKYSIDDLKKMSEKDLAGLFSQYGAGITKAGVQSQYNQKLVEIARVEASIRKILKGADDGLSPQQSTSLESDRKELAILKEELKGYQKQLKEIADAEKEAAFRGLSPEEQKKLFQAQRDAIKAERDSLLASDPDVLGVNKQQKIDELTDLLALADKELEKFNDKNVLKNKDFWEKQKEDAQKAIDEIANKIDDVQFARLKEGDTKGIADEVVKAYNDASGKLAQAKKVLDIYDKSGKKAAEQEKADKTLSDKITASQLELEKSRLAIMKDGRKKEIAEIRLSTKEKIAEIDKQERELKEAYKKAGKTPSDEELGVFDSRRAVATTKGEQGEKEVNTKYFDLLKEKQSELTDIFLSDEQRKEKAIKDRYDKERKWAGEMVKTGGMDSTQYAAFIGLSFMAETEANLQAFKEKYKTVADQITEIERQAQEDRKKATTDAQKKQVDEWEKTQKSKVLSDELMKDPVFGDLMGNLDKFSTSKISELLGTAREQVAAKLKEGVLAKDLESQMNAITKGEKEIKERNPFKALKDAIEQYKKLPEEDRSLKDIALIASAGFATLQGAITAVTDGLKGMGVTIDQETEDILNSFSNLAGSLSDMFTLNPVKMISGLFGVITSVMDIFDKRSRDAQRQIREHEEAVKRLQKEYNALEQAIKKAFSTDYYKKQVDQAINLEKQISELYKMIEAERSKRKRKQDQEQIESWKSEIEDLRSQAADIRQAVIDELMTTDLKSFSSSLASSMIDGYVEGMEDLSDVAQDSWDTLMQNMIAKQFDMLVVQKLMKPVFDAMEQSLNIDNGDFTFDENDLSRIGSASGTAMKNILAAGENYRKLIEGLGLITDEQERSSAAKGVAQASQDSVDELGGTLTAALGILSSINEGINEGFEYVSSISDQIGQLLNHVRNIDTNTARLEGMEKNMEKMKNSLEMIETKGLKLNNK